MSSFSLTSDVVNYLIYRYLQEAGFTHSAFTFASESLVARTNIDPNNVPPGSLVTFIQKGLQYLEIEANLDTQDGDVDGDYKLLTPEELLSNDVDQLRAIVAERKEEDSRPKGPLAEKTKADKERAREKDKEKEKPADKPEKTDKADKADKEREREKVPAASAPSAATTTAAGQAAAAAAPPAAPPAAAVAPAQPPPAPVAAEPRVVAAAAPPPPATAVAAAAAAAPPPPPQAPPAAVKLEPRPSSGPTPMDEDTPPPVPSSAPPTIEVPASSVVTLNGHDSEVYICAWSPVEPLLASGSGDSTARIWNLSTSAGSSYTRSVVLNHESKQDKTQGKDVTTLDWNADGSLLATGSYDGLARIWSKDGKLRQTLDKHQGPIFALKWNKRGDLLLSGSVDKTAIVWDAKTGEAKQTFELHSAPTLDVDWRNSNSFATCSTDKLIHVCKLGETKAVKTYAGHDDEVNAIKWDPSGRLLASCSDDRTAKVWSLNSDRPVQDFKDHDREIYTIRWSPTGPGSANPNMPLLLASASFDTTVRLWDIEAGRCVQCLHRHVEPVYSVAFSPNGKLVATGSFDKCVYVWSVDEGVLVRSFRGDAGIYEVCWNKEGNRVAACFANRTICVMDIN